MKKLTIITTFYNAEEYIEEAVRSVLKQKHEDFTIEYILVDDKSEDKSRSIVEKLSETITDDDTIEMKIFEPDYNLGCGGARRFGIQNGTGDMFMFLDADDYYIHDDFCQRAMNDIIKNDADIVEYGIIYNSADKAPERMSSAQEIIIDNKMKAMIYLYKMNIIRFNIWNKIYTKKIVTSVPYSTERTFEDVKTIPLWCWCADKIVVKPSVEVNYRATSNSIIRNDGIETRIGTVKAIASNFDIFRSSKDILKAMYSRAMIDIEAVLVGRSSKDLGFKEMAKLNKYMLDIIRGSEDPLK